MGLAPLMAESQGLCAHGRFIGTVHMTESRGLCTWQSHRDSVHMAESQGLCAHGRVIGTLFTWQNHGHSVHMAESQRTLQNHRDCLHLYSRMLGTVCTYMAQSQGLWTWQNINKVVAGRKMTVYNHWPAVHMPVLTFALFWVFAVFVFSF